MMNEKENNASVEVPPVSGVFAEPWSPKKLMAMLACFGPAAIVASVSIGAGETIVVVRAGAWAQYGLLWLVLLSCVVKGIFVTYLLGRYTAVSGEHIGHRLVRLPGPRGWLLLTIVALEMVGAPLAWVPIAKPCGDLGHFLLGDFLHPVLSETVWKNIFTSVFITLALVVGLGISFQRLERQQIAICCILVGGTIAGTLMVRPDILKTIIGALQFGKLPSFPPWTPKDTVKYPLLTMATAFGYVGGSVMGYIVYANWVGIHKWGMTGHKDIEAIRRQAFSSDSIDYLPDDPEQRRRLRKLTAPLRWDVGMGALVLFIVTAAFMVSGAAVLYPLHSEFKGWSLLTDQAHVWRNIHPALVWVYYVCILAALWGTLQALPEIYARVTQEFFQAVWPDREWSYRNIQRVIVAYIFVATMVIVWTNAPFDILTQIAGFILANFAVGIICLAAIYLNFKLPPAYRTRLYMLIGAILSFLVLAGATALSGWGLARKILGWG